MRQQRKLGLTVAIAAIFLVFWIVVSIPMFEQKRDNDFLCMYNGWTLVLQGDWHKLYDPEAQLSVQHTISDISELRPFTRPPVYALIFSPFALIPFKVSFWVWLCGWTVLLAVCSWWAAKRFEPDAMIFGTIGIPFAFGIAHGQDNVLLLALLVLSFCLAERERPFAAGAAAGLCCVKFHLLIAFPLLLLFQRRWRSLAGFSAAGALLAIVSVALVGISGVRQYVSFLSNKSIAGLNPSRERMPNVHAIFHNFELVPYPLVFLLIAGVLILSALAVKREWWRMYAVFPIAAVLIAPHTYYYDATMFLLSAWLITFEMKSRFRPLAQLLVTPLPYLVMIPGAPWTVLVPILFVALLAGLAWEAHRSTSEPSRLETARLLEHLPSTR